MTPSLELRFAETPPPATPAVTPAPQGQVVDTPTGRVFVKPLDLSMAPAERPVARMEPVEGQTTIVPGRGVVLACRRCVLEVEEQLRWVGAAGWSDASAGGHGVARRWHRLVGWVDSLDRGPPGLVGPGAASAPEAGFVHAGAVPGVR